MTGAFEGKVAEVLAANRLQALTDGDGEQSWRFTSPEELAALIAEALGVETREEYGVRYASDVTRVGSREIAEVFAASAVTRTVTTLRIEGEWVEVEG